MAGWRGALGAGPSPGMGFPGTCQRGAPSEVGSPCATHPKGLHLGTPVLRVHRRGGVDGVVVETSPEGCFERSDVPVASTREPRGCRTMGWPGGDDPTCRCLAWQNLGWLLASLSST